MNYFQLFSLEPSFSIDLFKLSEVYQRLQKTVHPDRYAHASSQEQLLAVQKSSTINDAYQTLKTPLKRAEYMLKIRNTDMPSEQASYRDNHFLMRQMELHEMLDEVNSAEDQTLAISQLTKTLDTEFEVLFEQMKDELAKNTQASNILASNSLRKLKFYQKLHVEVDRLEERLFDL